MKYKYILLSYTYYTYCQGTRDRNHGYSLLKVPEDAGMAVIKGTLYNEKHIDGSFEMDSSTIINETIEF